MELTREDKISLSDLRYKKGMEMLDDYDDFSEVSEAEAERAVKDARKFIKNIAALRKKLKNDLS